MKRWFKLSIPEHVLRSMTRDEYYTAQRWRRVTERNVAAGMEQNSEAIDKAMHDLATYGSCNLSLAH